MWEGTFWELCLVRHISVFCYLIAQREYCIVTMLD